MIKAVIIDDEQNNILNLEAILSSHFPEIELKGYAENAEDGIELINAQKPDLVFLDIQMPGKSGFDMLKAFNTYHFEVIFITAYDQYGIQAVKFAAIDYILKPVNIDELKEAVQKVVSRSNVKKQNLRLENLIDLLEKNKQKEEHQIALPTLKETIFVKPEQIIRCESSNNYTTFHLVTGEQVIISKPIYEYEETLSEYGFIRCHQSHLVNKKYIKSYIKEYGGQLLMQDKTEIPVSRHKKEYVLRELNLR